MRMKSSKNLMGISLLIICLLLTGYVSVFNTADPANVNVYNASPINGEDRNTSMNGGAYSWHFSYQTAADTVRSFLFVSPKQFHSQLAGIIFSILTAIAAAQLICLIYSSKLSNRFCLPFNSLSITTFLHKQDGMK